MTTHVLQATGVGHTLGEVSKALQALHQHLLAFQADRSFFYGSPLELFDRATKDPAFGWLVPLREAIVALDERRADKDAPMTEEDAKAIADEVRRLLDSEDGSFRDSLNAAFQYDPEVVMALASAKRSLATLH